MFHKRTDGERIRCLVAGSLWPTLSMYSRLRDTNENDGGFHRRPEPETPNIPSYYSTLGGFFLSQLYHNYSKNISIIVTDME